MATASAKKSIDPDKLDTLGESYTNLGTLTAELKDSPGSWVEDASAGKLTAVNELLAQGSTDAKGLIKSLEDYLKTVGQAFRDSELNIVQGIEGNGSGAGSNDTGVYESWLADSEAQKEAAAAKQTATKPKTSGGYSGSGGNGGGGAF